MTSYHCKISKVSTLIFISVFSSSIFSCNNGGKSSISSETITSLFSKSVYDVTTIGKNISTYLQTNKNGFVYDSDSIFNIKDLENLYASNNNKAIWLSGTGANKNAISFLNNLQSIEDDGLNIKKLHIQDLLNMQKKIEGKITVDNIAQNFDIGMSVACIQACNAMMHGQFKADSFNEDWFNKTDTQFNASAYVQNCIAKDSIDFMFANLRPNLPIYQKLVAKLKVLKTIKKAGGWEVINNLKDSLPNGMDNKNVGALRKRLNKEIGLPLDTSSTIVKDDLQTAIQSFQYLHDLKLSGKLDTSTLKKINTPIDKKIKNMQSNLERLRWLQKDVMQPYVWVNIPKMELQYIDADSTQFKMRVVVGRTSRPTPTLNATMTNLVINPGWSVPPTIMKEEVVPGIGRRGGSYLSRRGLKAFYRGRAVSGDQINEKNYKSFSIQQKPGLNSALGAVKFNMPNRHAIYLHDTPHREDFVKYYRAYSSGCIRVEKPRDFATFLLQDSNYTSLKIDTFIRKKITKDVPMKKKLEVHIVYLTNGLDSLGNVMYLRDIYNKDAKMENVWN